jgi:membrane protease YdiL (CAAX protease family)
MAGAGKPGVWRYLVVIVCGVAAAAAAGAGLSFVLALTGRLGPDAVHAMQDPSRFGPFFLGVALSFGLLLLGFWLASRLVQGRRWGDVVGRWRWDLTAAGFGVWLGIVALGALVDFLLQPSGFSLSVSGRTPLFVLTAAPALALQTFAEEFVFRGVVTQGLVRVVRRPAIACLISGLIFGAAHIPNGPAQAARATVFGMVLAFMAIETGGLALGWGLHLANNLFSGVVVISSSDVFKGAAGLFRQDTRGLDGFDVAFTMAALLLASWVLLRRAVGSEPPAARASAEG